MLLSGLKQNSKLNLKLKLFRMSTPTKKTSKKAIQNEMEVTPIPLALSPSLSQSKTNNVKSDVLSDPNLTRVTSLNLLRLTITDNKKPLKLTVTEDDYKDVLVMGIKHGVTWDEIVRGLIRRESCSLTPGDGLENFIPALQ